MVSGRPVTTTALEVTLLLGLFVVLTVVYWPMWRITPDEDDFGVIAIASGMEKPYAGRHMFRPLELCAVRLSLFLSGDPVSASAFRIRRLSGLV